MDTNRVVIDTSDDNQGPSVQESYDNLVKEGIIADDENLSSQQAADGGQGGDGVEADGQTDDRPSWLPEKFKSPEDLAKAYSELEKKQSQGEPKETDSNDGKTPEGEEGDEEAREVVEKAGLDFDALTQEWTETGNLSDESIQRLVDGGIPRNYVDAYLEGVKAQVALFENSVKDLAGGAEAYDTLLQWGAENLTDAEIDAFDEAVNSGNLQKATIAVKGLSAQMQLAQGVHPQRQVDGKGGGAGTDVYESYAQLEADMNDPRYANDEAFRQKVYAKLNRSNI